MPSSGHKSVRLGIFESLFINFFSDMTPIFVYFLDLAWSELQLAHFIE